MNKFKVSDKVRMTNPSSRYYDREGVVIEIASDRGWMPYRVDFRDNTTWFAEGELEFAEPQWFERITFDDLVSGDKVRITNDDELYEGPVKMYHPSEPGVNRLGFSSKLRHLADQGYKVYAQEPEPEPEPEPNLADFFLTVPVGTIVLDRDNGGRRVKVSLTHYVLLGGTQAAEFVNVRSVRNFEVVYQPED